MIIFKGNATLAYRDPACYFFGGSYHLFFTMSVKENGYMYNFVAKSKSADLKEWSAPEILTEKDCTKNYCSPGNIIPFGDEYLVCFSSYPMPVPFKENPYADHTARLYFMWTRDFVNFSAPEKLFPKGAHCSFEEEGRMIDPYLLSKGNELVLFFKQNGVSMSTSQDLKNWKFLGSVDGGENACVIPYEDRYLLLHSPNNGIGFKISNDLEHWEVFGHTTLKQDQWEWASGRLTAAFAMEAKSCTDKKYIIFFHGSKKDSEPETHGEASLALCFTNDFKEFFYEIV